MTAAKAVETSVISTNSLSQGYTNLDDRLPQTCIQNVSFEKAVDAWMEIVSGFEILHKLGEATCNKQRKRFEQRLVLPKPMLHWIQDRVDSNIKCFTFSVIFMAFLQVCLLQFHHPSFFGVSILFVAKPHSLSRDLFLCIQRFTLVLHAICWAVQSCCRLYQELSLSRRQHLANIGPVIANISRKR